MHRWARCVFTVAHTQIHGADIDECVEDRHRCDRRRATCTNTNGAYTCTCRRGYVGDGHVCVDTDECAVNHAHCAASALCVNTHAGHVCICATGYVGDGRVCEKTGG
jgi:hypothetical protein